MRLKNEIHKFGTILLNELKFQSITSMLNWEIDLIYLWIWYIKALSTYKFSHDLKFEDFEKKNGNSKFHDFSVQILHYWLLTRRWFVILRFLLRDESMLFLKLDCGCCMYHHWHSSKYEYTNISPHRNYFTVSKWKKINLAIPQVIWT